MQLTIAGYEVKTRLEDYYASSLFLASHAESGKTALIKTLAANDPPQEDTQRLEREYRVLESLRGVDGVLQVATLDYQTNGAPAILCSTSGVPLTQYLRDRRYLEWPIEQIIDFAIGLARAIDAIHERQVIHKNIAPQSILLDSETWSVHLMNFEIATVLSNERQNHSISKRLEGSLPYVSPEQTGRMNRSLDYRSDFYSLGMVLYQILAGALPFDASNTLEWVHAHISRLPPRPQRADRALPAPLVEIVMKLIAKNPDDRYQSTFGLICDLQECRRRLDEDGEITPFEIAARDVSEVFQIPLRLFGRESELASLLGLFNEVKEGACETCLISGFSGVGKSALVDELNRPLLRARGYFVRGKFDQFERAKPYSAITSAFSGLIHEFLTEPPERLDFWRQTISEALGVNGQALVDVIPDLAKIVGSQPALLALPPTETQNRFQITFGKFLAALARPERPLILFLDDLQWSDGPTLNLLQKLATSREITNLLLLGAYRSNEVEPGHPLALMRDQIAQTRLVHELALEPLDHRAVSEIIASALRTTPDEVVDLSVLLFRKTEGNPFFLNELLRTLVEDQLVSFDRTTGCWTWEIDRVRQAEINESVVEFLVANLRKLPEETRDALKLAACIGNEFDLRTLSVVYQRPMAEVGAAIMRALSRNVLLPLDEDYQYFDQSVRLSGGTLDPGINPRFRFQHDRLQQAAHELIDAENRQRVHLLIGRMMRLEMDEIGAVNRLIEITQHLNEGRELLTDAEEIRELATMNLEAGRRAHDASAYREALVFLEIGRALLGADAWESEYQLAKSLSSLFAQTTYLNGLHDAAEAEIELALGHVRTRLEKAQVLSMRTRHYSTLGRMADSIDAALKGLQLLGIEIRADLPDAEVAAEIEAVERNLAGREIADLVSAPRMDLPEIAAAVELLMEIFPPAFLSGAGNLFHFLVARSVNLSLQHGSSTETAFAYAAYGMLLCGTLNDPRTGYEFGHLALEMNEAFDDIGLKSRIIYVYAMFIHHWTKHWSTMTEWFRKGLEAGTQSGDLLYLAYNAQDCIIWDPTLDLDTASAEQRKLLSIVRECNYQDSYDSGSLFLQMQLNFLDRTDGLYSLDDEDFDEATRCDGMADRGFLTGVANFHIYKTEIHCFYNDHAGARAHIEAMDGLTNSVMSLPQLVRYRFVSFLALSALLPDMTDGDRAATQERLERDHRQMRLWANSTPVNFLHLERAMAAELARHDGDYLTAFGLFEEARQGALRNGFLRDEGVINELAAEAYATLGLRESADAHLRNARAIFARWGAVRKVRLMDKAHPSLAAAPTDPAATSRSLEAQDGDGIALASLDLASVMKAARAISGEIVLTNLWAHTMQILLENAGAQRGVFVTRQKRHLQVEAEGSVEDGQIEVSPNRVGRSGNEAVPVSVVTYALRTRSPVVLDDASASPKFAGDPYVAARDTKSVLCVPIVRSETFEGAIYLENNIATGAFPQDRIDIVEMLAAQAAISIENARLYVDLERKVEERTLELSQKSAALEVLANQLSKYLAPQVYQSIFDSKKEVRLTSERKRLTVFFSDLVGFTETADRLESEELTQLLNQYLTEMSNIALTHGATIDKFIGDAVMVFFGDPESQGVREDALDCVRMAIAMRERLKELRAEWHEQGIEKPLECRMGIHTGYCTVGNFGSETRMDYTIIGGAVNLASRLEDTAAPGQIMISYETYAQVKNEILCKEHGTMNIRGIAHGVATYEVVDLIENIVDERRPMYRDLPHLQINVDIANMTEEERSDAARMLREAVDRLEKYAQPNAGSTESPGTRLED